MIATGYAESVAGSGSGTLNVELAPTIPSHVSPVGQPQSVNFPMLGVSATARLGFVSLAENGVINGGGAPASGFLCIGLSANIDKAFAFWSMNPQGVWEQSFDPEIDISAGLYCVVVTGTIYPAFSFRIGT